MEAATALARRHGLACHLDGARIFNAATALNTPVTTLARSFDTVSVCLSKGLGAPVGSVLVGSAPLIAKARRTRKMLGGGLRQVGILAAAGLYALEHNVERLADDHANAKFLAQGLASFEQLKVTMPDTNIVFVEVDSKIAADFSAYLAARGIGITSSYGATKQRWVTHLDVNQRGRRSRTGRGPGVLLRPIKPALRAPRLDLHASLMKSMNARNGAGMCVRL